MADLTADDAAWLRLFAGLIRKDEPHRSGAAYRLDAIADTVDPPKRTLRDEVALAMGCTCERRCGDCWHLDSADAVLAVVHARFTAEVKALTSDFHPEGMVDFRSVLALGDALFAPVVEVQP